jgi:hypothetical protein
MREILDFVALVVIMSPCMWYYIILYIHQGRAGWCSRYSESLRGWKVRGSNTVGGPVPMAIQPPVQRVPGHKLAETWRWPSTILQRRGCKWNDLTPVRLPSFATSSAPIHSARRPPSARASDVNRRKLFWQPLYNVVCSKSCIMRRDSVFKQCPRGLIPDVREEREKRNGRVTPAY